MPSYIQNLYHYILSHRHDPSVLLSLAVTISDFHFMIIVGKKVTISIAQYQQTVKLIMQQSVKDKCNYVIFADIVLF